MRGEGSCFGRGAKSCIKLASWGSWGELTLKVIHFTGGRSSMGTIVDRRRGEGLWSLTAKPDGSVAAEIAAGGVARVRWTGRRTKHVRRSCLVRGGDTSSRARRGLDASITDEGGVTYCSRPKYHVGVRYI